MSGHAGAKRPLPGVGGGAPELSDHALLEIKPLGGGQEVGRSCLLLKYCGVTVLLDCGVLPSQNGHAALPFLDHLDPASIDVIVITHFHLDHCAALPYLTERLEGFKGRIFATHPTIAVMKMILQDYCRVSAMESGEGDGDGALFEEADIVACVARMETVDFHQRITLGALTLTFFSAGHVLGAAMVQVEIGGMRLLYTGDYSCEEDRHLCAAEVPPGRAPDVLIVEATHGITTSLPREVRERMFIEAVERIVARGGRCLIPVFALGRAQELLLILDEHWEASPQLRGRVPIFHANSMAHKGLEVYKTFLGHMNARLQARAAAHNPWAFRHITHIRGAADFDRQCPAAAGPCVVLASPGMLQKGFSRALFDRWCEDARNGVVLAGYAAEGTLARRLELNPTVEESGAGRKMARRLSIDRISFSAHADFTQTSGFVEALRPFDVVLVHGERGEMGRLKHELEKRYLGQLPNFRSVREPENTHTLQFPFEEQHLVRIVGALARRGGGRGRAGARISGVLVQQRNLSHLLLAPADLPAYTELAPASLRQALHVPFRSSYGILAAFVTAMFPDACEEPLDGEERAAAARGPPGARALSVWGGRARLLYRPPDRVVATWLAEPLCDMLVDTLVAVITQAEVSQVAIKALGRHDHAHGDHAHGGGGGGGGGGGAHDGHAHAHAHGEAAEGEGEGAASAAAAAAATPAPAAASAPAPPAAPAWQRWLLSRSGADLSQLPAAEAAAIAAASDEASLALLLAAGAAAGGGGDAAAAGGAISAAAAARALRACPRLSAAEVRLAASLLALLLPRYTPAGLRLDVAAAAGDGSPPATAAPTLTISVSLDQAAGAADVSGDGDGDGGGGGGGSGGGGGDGATTTTTAAAAAAALSVGDAPPLLARIEYHALAGALGQACPAAAADAAAPAATPGCSAPAGFLIAVGGGAELDLRVPRACGACEAAAEAEEAAEGGGGGGSAARASARLLPAPAATPTLARRLLDAGDLQGALAADLERAVRAAFVALL